MKDYILNRYDKDKDENLLIKIYTTKVEDLYEDFDKKSSFIKKDLKDNLKEYLYESAYEIGNRPFKIQFYFEEKITEDSSLKLHSSIQEYFSYLQFLKKKVMKENIKNSIIFSIIGFLLVFISFSLSIYDKMYFKIISEGIMIGGWVALWEALATILVGWLPLRKELKIYNKIANAKIDIY